MGAPILITTWPFGDAANRAAWPALGAGGSALDAVTTACAHAEDDPSVDSVGYGGLPDAVGRVTLDALVMLSPARLGAVCALGRTRRAAAVARLVMERTPHVLLAGEGADRFAAQSGLAEEDLLAPAARAALEARRAIGAGTLGGHDTIAALALDRAGALAGATSTSGRAWKLPGRVGDAPIPGHGLYVDPTRGAAAATGDGELVSGVCASFAAVEALGRGAAPLDALADALERLRAAHDLAADAQVAMIALARDGRVACAALRAGFVAAVADADGPRLLEPGLVLLDP